MQLHEMPNHPKVFIGMDVHKKSWSVSIQTDLFFHKTFSMPPEPDALYRYIEQNFSGHQVSLTYEVGSCDCNAPQY